jgi:hypothetical protein
MNHFWSPLMKLPGIKFRPWRTQTPPTSRAIRPTVIRVLRPTRLFTEFKLPAKDSQSRCVKVLGGHFMTHSNHTNHRRTNLRNSGDVIAH